MSNKELVLDIKDSYLQPGVKLEVKAKRAYLTIGAKFEGRLILNHYDPKVLLDTININSNTNVEIISIFKHEYNVENKIKVKIKKDANLKYDLLFSPEDYSSQDVDFYIGDDVNIEANVLDLGLGDKDVRYRLNMNGRNSAFNFEQAILANKKVKKTIYIEQNNYAPKTEVSLSNYGVAFDNASVFIEGSGTIAKGAINSSNHQKTKFLVLSPGAKAIARPLLIIDENEVEASHALTFGTFDENIIFYLLSRGLSLEQAKTFLVMGLFKPVLDKISQSEIHEEMLEYIQGVI